MYQKTNLPNGLRLLVTPLLHTQAATVALFFAVGSRYESAEQSGVAHYVEHLLFKGSARWPTAQAISEAIEGVGGLLNAMTDQETTVYWSKVPYNHLDLALDLLADMTRHPQFDPQEVQKERQVILEEINITLDSPADLVGLLIDQVLWGDQPLGRDIAGTLETVSRLQREDLIRFWAGGYSPTTLILSIAGRLDPQQVTDQVIRLFGDWPAQPAPTWTPARDDQAAPRFKLYYKDTEQVNLCLAVPGLAITDPERYALILMNTLLGEGMSSRLFLELREKRGLTYDVHSAIDRFRDTGTAVVFAGVEPRRAETAIRAILDELHRLVVEPPSEAELTKAKEMNKGRLLLGLEDSRNVATWLGSQEALTGEIILVDELIAAIEAVTPADIQHVARRLFQPQRLNLAIVGPFKKAERFARLIGL